jgi:hypothetical protein
MGWSEHLLRGPNALAGANDLAYDTYAHFDDTEANIYAYSYCDIDENFFDSERITSHSEFQDSSETLNTECTLYEYLTPNFPMCHPAHGGFVSPSARNQPTDTAVPDGYLTQIFQEDDYTGIKLVQCPEFTDATMVEGGTDIYYACHIKNLNECKDSTSDYCNSGQDWSCPDGMSLKTDPTWTRTYTINDCESCGAGQVCSASAAATVCPDGYNCEAQTTDVESKPGQPGEFLTRNGDNNDIGDCTNGYCPGATHSGNKETCPSGYYNDYSGASSDNQHSAAGCSPTPAGTYSSSQTQCTAGRMCPPGAKDEDLQIPTGFYATTPNRGYISHLVVCPDGKFCAEGSTDANTDCTAGMYCVAGTVFEYDTPCSFGKTSSAGA